MDSLSSVNPVHFFHKNPIASQHATIPLKWRKDNKDFFLNKGMPWLMYSST